MSNNFQENVQGSDKLVSSLLQVNKLLYKMPPSLGIATRRQHRIDFSQSQAYTSSETIVFDAQTGSAFIDPRNSYLKITIKAGVGGLSFNSGSACNVFNRVVVRTRSGKELSRLENANLYIKNMQRYECSQEWLDTIGALQGYSKFSTTPLLTVGTEVPVAGKTYIIPISAIAPCFNPIGKLLPPQLMEGLRIEIQLETASIALGNVNTTSAPLANAYTVEGCEIHWDSYDLASQYQRAIAQMAARQGLNIMYKEAFHTIVNGNVNQYNFDVKKAASKALKCLIISRDQANSINALNHDSMESMAYDYTRQQLHTGSSYFPNAPLSTADVTINGFSESYYQTAFAMDKLECWNPPSVTPQQYVGFDTTVRGTVTQTTFNNCGIAYNLNKSAVSDLQGYQLNNSKALLVDLTTTKSISRRIDAYLIHLRAVKQFTSNAEVRD